MTKKKSRINTTDPRSPQLFSNEELGLPPVEYEYRGTRIVTDKHGKRVRQAVIVRTKDSFVRAAREVWGDQNDYSESVLTGMKEPITIRCRKHDYYYTVPFAQNHIINPNGKVKPTGCPLCEAESIGYYPKNRGHHRFRTPEEKQREAEEKARIKAERKQQKQQNLEERRQKHEREKREQQELMAKYGAKSMPEARFIEKVQQQYGYDTALVDYQGQDTDVTLFCPIHGMFEITPRILFNGVKGSAPHGCWLCAGLQDPHTKYRLTAREFYRRTDARYGKKIIFERKRKIKPTTNITGTCYRHGPLTHDVQWWLSGKGCEYCNGKFYPPDFERLARAAQGDDYIYKGVENIKSAADSVMVHCGNPDHEWHEMLVSLCLHGSKCRECAGRHQPLEQRRSQFVEDCLRKHGEGHFLIHAEDYVNAHSPIRVRCLVHHYDYQTSPDNLLRGAGGCPFCSSSEGEAVIRGWLVNHGIPFDPQYTLPNLDHALPLQYVVSDFYLPADSPDKFPLVIEYHGEQHYEDIAHFYHGKSVRTFAVQQHRDRYLRQYCADHHLRLLEIPYWEFDHIDTILTSVLLNHEPIPTFEPPADKT